MIRLLLIALSIATCNAEKTEPNTNLKCGKQPETEIKDINLGKTEMSIGLLRIKDTTWKGEQPVLKDYSVFDNIALNALLTEQVPGFEWFSPRPVKSRVEDAAQLLDSEWYCPEVPSIMLFYDTGCYDVEDEVSQILKGLTLRNFHLNYNIFVMDLQTEDCTWFSSLIKGFTSTFGRQTYYEFARSKVTEFIVNGISKGKMTSDQINIIALGYSNKLACEVIKNLKSKIKSYVGLNPYKDIPSLDAGNDQIEIFHMYQIIPIQQKYKTVEGSVNFQIIVETYKDTDYERAFRSHCVNTFLGLMLEPQKFKAWKCESLETFKSGGCDKDEVGMTYPPTPTSEGTYFLRVSHSFPNGVGDDGRRFDEATVRKGNRDNGEGIHYDPGVFHVHTPDELLKIYQHN